MPDDILDAAQKAINEAATGAKPPEPVPPAPSLPIEPQPTPVTTDQPPQATVTQPESPKKEEVSASPLPPPPPPDPSLDATKQAMMNELLGSSTVAPVAQPSHTAPPSHSSGNIAQKKKPRTGIILAAIALLLLTVPIAVYFVSQNGPVAELRSRAGWDTVYQGCTLNSCPSGYTCHCQNGNACTYTWCEAGIEESCRRQGREYCTNGYNGNAKTCCLPGYHCGTDQNPGCFREGGDDNGDDTVQPTATPPTVPVCQNIKAYKGGTQVTPSTLLPGDVVTLAVKGNLAPTKARFRINGGAWQETTTKNASNEFTLSYTIPDGVPDFVIEGEVFTDGAWH